jgi:hypothetical protein
MFTDDVQVYYAIFAAMDIIAMFLVGYLLIKICRVHTKYWYLILIVYMLVTAIYCDHAVRKFDIIAVVVMTLSIYLFLNKRYELSIIMAVVGALIKIFPVILIPVFIIMVLKDRDALKSTMKGLVVCIGIGLVAVAAIVATGMMSLDNITGFISSQNARSFHMCSTVGALSAMVCEWTGKPTSYVIEANTLDVKNYICDALIGGWMTVFAISLIVVIILVAYLYLRNPPIDSDEDYFKFLTAASLALMIVFLLMNKVFSTTYLQWSYPLLIMFLCYRGKFDTLIVSAIYISTMVLTIVFLNSGTNELMLLRAIILSVLVVLCFRYMYKRKWDLGLDEPDDPPESDSSA